MTVRCPECGSASTARMRPPGMPMREASIANMGMAELGRAVTGTSPIRQPNAPNRSCDSCGAQFRNKYVKCPACRSVDIAPIVYKRGDAWSDAEPNAENAEWEELGAKLGVVAMPPDSSVNRPTFVCRECQNAFRTRPEPCPACGSHNIKRIVQGYPAPWAFEDPGRVMGGGCCVSPESPTKQCADCGHNFGRLGRGY